MRLLFLVLPLLLASAAPALADDPIVPISIRDHQFVPAEVSLPAGVKVKLLVKNERQVNAEFESNSLHREKIVNPGSEVAVYVGPLDPGSYDIFDDFNSETRGRIIVK